MNSLKFCLFLFFALPLVAEAAEPAAIQRLEAETLEAINQARSEAGLSPLQSMGRLKELARDHSRYMLKTQELSHEGPKGQNIADRVLDAGIRYRLVGENVAMNYNQPQPVEAAVSGWLSSPGHRANILKPGFTHTGVGIVGQGDTYYFTQIFLRPRD